MVDNGIVAGIQTQGPTVKPGSQAQLWTFPTVSTGVYNIVNSGSGLYLDVVQSNPANGISVITWPQNGGFNNQQWTLRAAA